MANVASRVVLLLGGIGVLGLVACGGDDATPGPGGGAETIPPVQDPPSDPPPPGSNVTPPPPDPAAPIARDKTYERAPGTSVTGKVEAEGASSVTFEIVTPPKQGRVGFIDATKGDFLYRPNQLGSAAADEFTYVAKAHGKASAAAKVSIGIKPLDFTASLDVRAAQKSWYSYNLQYNFNNAGTTDCGAAQTLTIASGKLLERAWACGTFPEIAISVSAGGFSGGTKSSGGSFRRVSILRKQLDARLAYREESTECSSYNSTLNSCNAGRSEDTNGIVYLGAAPTTTTAPVMQPSGCETTAGKPCEGFLLASDAEADLLSFMVKTQPQNGGVTIDAEYKGFWYTPKAGFVGTDTFTVVADDTPNGAGGESAPVTITVVVK